QLPREQLVDDAKRTRARVVILDERTAHLGADFLDAGFEVFCAGRGDGGISDLLSKAEQYSDEFKVVPRSQSDMACINFTSGTSGQSKGVVFTHGTLGNSAL